MRSLIEIASDAFNLVGMPSISSFEADEGDEAVAAGRMIINTAQELFCLRRWTFCSTEVLISIDDSKTPDSGWSAVLTIPTDVLQLWAVRVNARPIDFKKSALGIHANVDENTEVYLDYTYYLDSTLWSVLFGVVVENMLASKFAAVFCEKDSLANYYRELGQMKLATAISIDSKSQTTRSMLQPRGSRLSSARRI